MGGDVRAPERIQLSRKKGWRKPENTVVVARPSKWGNPFRVMRMDGGGYRVIGGGKMIWAYSDDSPFTRVEAAECAVDEYRRTYPPRSIFARECEIHLAGKNLACWCPLDQPCHADVLLELANEGQPILAIPGDWWRARGW